jgi:hypothetical protein
MDGLGMFASLIFAVGLSWDRVCRMGRAVSALCFSGSESGELLL